MRRKKATACVMYKIICWSYVPNKEFTNLTDKKIFTCRTRVMLLLRLLICKILYDYIEVVWCE